MRTGHPPLAATAHIVSHWFTHANALVVASPILPWAMAGIFVVLGVMVSLKTPLYQGADEGWHYAYVEHYALGRPLPNLNKHFTTGDSAAPYWQTHEATQPPLYYVLMGRLVALIPRGDLIQEQVLLQGGAPNGMYGNYLPSDDGSLGTGQVLAGHLVRFATVLMGAVVVICAYYITLTLTRRAEIAVLTTALVAFNPRNLVLSGAISNDMAVACVAALTLLLVVHFTLTEHEPPFTHSFLLGILAGLTLLTKYSGGVVVVAAAFAILVRMIRSRHSLRWLFLNGALLVAGALLVTGAYFAHNWQLYGDILAWNRVNEMNPANLTTPRTLQNTLEWLPFILKSYFAHPGFVFTWPNRHNEFMYVVFLVGMSGALWLMVRRKLGAAYWPMLAAIVVNVITYYSWMSSRDSTQNMRFFSPMYIPITLLIAMGILVFVPNRWQKGFAVCVTVVYGLFTSVTLYDSLNEMYAFPQYLNEAEARDLMNRPDAGRIRFENGIELLEVQLEKQRIDSGSPIELSIVWRTTTPLTTSAHLMLDIRNSQDKTVGALNTGTVIRYSYVSRAWLVGRPLRENYQIMPDTSQGEVLRILAGWWLDGGGLIRPVDNPSVSVEVGRIKVRGPEATAPIDTKPLATLENLADLVSARVESDTVILNWRATTEPAKNYTIFVHGLDTQQKIARQHDVPFEYSAAYWSRGEQFEQRIEIPGIAQTASIQVGVYDPDTGQRFRALKSNGSDWADGSIVLK